MITTDLIEEAGMQVASMSAGTKQRLQAVLPRAASVINPIDVLGDAHADRYQQALEAIAQEPEIDAVIVLLTPQVMTQIQETAAVVSNFVKTYKKPVICSFIGHEHVHEGIVYLHEHAIPCFSDPLDAVRVLAQAYSRFTTSQKKSHSMTEHTYAFTAPVLTTSSGPVQDIILEPRLRDTGFSLPPSHIVENEEEAVQRAEAI